MLCIPVALPLFLTLFARQHPSTLTSISELLSPIVDDSTGTPFLLTPSLMPLITERNANGLSTLLEMKYGLQLELDHGHTFKASDISAHPQ
jgi:hypothetical protein